MDTAHSIAQALFATIFLIIINFDLFIFCVASWVFRDADSGSDLRRHFIYIYFGFVRGLVSFDLFWFNYNDSG